MVNVKHKHTDIYIYIYTHTEEVVQNYFQKYQKTTLQFQIEIARNS